MDLPDAPLSRAGLELSNQSEKSIQLTDEQCINEMQRVASLLGTAFLTREIFNKHGEFSCHRVVRTFGSWHEALNRAGLAMSPNFRTEITLAELASDFLKVVIELERIPSLIQLTRRSKYSIQTLSRSRGGYRSFKQAVIAHLLSSDNLISSEIKELLAEEQQMLGQSQIEKNGSNISSSQSSSVPHHQGRTLNFRAFSYAPTCEHDVVQMFGAIAHELGFEIIGNRSAFPDCEARRRVKSERERYEACIIEYEFSSVDYKRHKHSVTGCDLIVCWQHNWAECPIEVLELQEEIRHLSGWR